MKSRATPCASIVIGTAKHGGSHDPAAISQTGLVQLRPCPERIRLGYRTFVPCISLPPKRNTTPITVPWEWSWNMTCIGITFTKNSVCVAA
jgi:hypothetical protein